MKEIPGYNGKYHITSKGKVFSEHKQDFLNIHPNTQVGYFQVSLWKDNVGKRLYIHRLVAEAFCPNPLNKPEVNHIDGNRQNNDSTNLEWVTSSENSYHASHTGLRIYTNRLTREEFLECLDSIIQGESYQSLSERVPYKVPFLSTKLRNLAQEIGQENLLDESLKQQKAKRNRKALQTINNKRRSTTIPKGSTPQAIGGGNGEHLTEMKI